MNTEKDGHCTRAGYAIWSLEIIADIQDGKEAHGGSRFAVECMWSAVSRANYDSMIEACERGF